MKAYTVPLVSAVIIVLAFLFVEPTTTGLAVLNPEGTRLVNADITLSTKEGEVIPPGAIVEVWIDNNRGEMTIADFIEKSGKESTIAQGELSEFGFFGLGYTGDHTYTLTLEDFNINREIGVGEHTFLTRIVYQGLTLYEKENNIVISEQR